MWPEEKKPWERIHMDHGYVTNVGYLLIVVDAYSSWPEVMRVRDRSTMEVMRVLREIFSRNGVPRTLVSDNAAEFCDQSLGEWLNHIGCRAM